MNKRKWNNLSTNKIEMTKLLMEMNYSFHLVMIFIFMRIATSLALAALILDMIMRHPMDLNINHKNQKIILQVSIILQLMKLKFSLFCFNEY